VVVEVVVVFMVVVEVLVVIYVQNLMLLHLLR
jgi:hypothetical protein